MALTPGQTLGRYQIIAPLGTGGMALVYKAYQPSLEREVALKVLRGGYAQDKEFVDRFEREARSIARLRHPNIVQVFDFETIEGRPVLAMEFLEGGTLKERIASLSAAGKRIERSDAVRILSEVAAALTYAHDRGIVHRDVKPANVMLSEGRAVVTDFGIAKILEGTSHTQTGVGIGTPEYMAPEQGQDTKGVDHRADIYSLGVMAYELLTGRLPFTADTPVAIVLAHMSDPLPLPRSIDPSIGPEVERALLKALAKNPADRFERAIDFTAALSQALPAQATMPTVMVGARPAATRRAAREPSRLPLVPLAAGAVVLALVVGGVLVTRGGGGPSPSASTSFESMRSTPYYEAKLDGVAADLVSFSPPDRVKVGGGQLTMTATDVPTGMSTQATPQTPPSTQYAMDFTVQFTAGSEGRFSTCLRRTLAQGSTTFPTPGATYCLVLTTTPEVLELQYAEPTGSGTRSEALGGGVSTAGARTRAVRLAIVVDRQTFTVFVDDLTKPALVRTDPRLTTPTSPVGFLLSRLQTNPSTGATVTISGLKLYRLATPAAGSPAAPTGPPASFAAMRAAAPYYAPKLDGVLSEVTASQPERIKVASGELTITPNDPVAGVGRVSVMPTAGSPSVQYAIEMSVQFAPGSDGTFSTCFRRQTVALGEAGYCVALSTNPEIVEMQYSEPTGPNAVRQVSFGGAVAVPGARSSATRVAIVIDRQTFTVFVNDLSKPAMVRTDDRLTGANFPPNLRLSRTPSAPNTSVTIRDLKMYSLK